MATFEQASTRERDGQIFFDHHSPEFRENNYETFDELRSQCPVAHSSVHGGFWVLTNHEAVDAAAKDDDLFNSYPSVGVPASTLPYPILPIESDPPLTQKLRSITLKKFSPGAADRLEPKMRELVTELIDAFIERGECDIVQELTTPAPARLILHMLGMDEQLYDQWVEWVHGVVHDRTHDEQKADAAGMSMFSEINKHMQLRRENGFGEDLLSTIMQGEIDGEPLDDMQITMYVFLMMLGGMDTTSGLTGNTFFRLTERPDLRERLISDRSVLRDAIEEFLRHDSPTQGLARTVGKDAEFFGQQLREGDRAILMWAAANRDPEVFPNPDEIDFDRENKRHMAFGVGMHRCLGSNIARLMARVMIDEVLNRLPDFELAGEATRFEDAGEVYAVRYLPIRFTADERRGAS